MMRKRRQSILWSVLLGSVVLCGGGLCLLSLPLEVTPFCTYTPSFALYDREGQLLCLLRSPDDAWLIPVPLKEMGKWIPLLAVESEDRRFFSHPGVDFLALGRAIWQNLRARKVVSGASTITTQLVRLVLPRERTLKGKLSECLLALRLERVLKKEDILESYLNRIPLGGNIKGVEAASWYYFGKSAKDLTLLEAASLVSLFPAPERFRPDKNPEGFLRRRNALLERLCRRGIISQEEYALYASSPPPTPRGFPRLAYHAAWFLRQTTTSPRVFSSLSFSLEEWLERLLDEALVTLPREITACTVVVENSTGAILAYVGNARFRRNPEQAFVDCLQAPRSPGSALKPFVYARAFDRGLLVPSSIIADTPFGLRGNVPRNFDEGFRGPVSCEMALALSLNVPAVRVARKVGLEDVLGLLQTLGFSRLQRGADFYGDALVLGGCEVTPLELARAYTALSRLGETIPLSFFREDENPQKKRVFSPGSAYMVAEILADRFRFNPLPKRTLPTPLCAFKTGTSYGFRDAWTVAYNPRYTVLVWFGDPQGLPHEELVGIRLAAPCALRIMEYLMERERVWYECPEDVTWREVCPISGKIASARCEGKILAPFLKGASPLEVCDLHATSLENPSFPWPGEVQAALGRPDVVPLAIVSPVPGRRYFTFPGASFLRLPLRAEGGKGPIFWFVDGAYAGQSQPGGTLFVSLPPGEHRIIASDKSGQSDTTEVVVSPTTFAKTRRDFGAPSP